MGLELDKLGQTDNAIEYYLKALRSKPDFANAHNNLGVAQIHKGNIDAAISCFQTVLKIDPNHVNAKNNLQKALDLKAIN
jgi:tetratricopeptide (TPR) repeat protein